MTKSDKAFKAQMEKQEREWRADSDLRTLIDAKKIEKDPDRMSAVEEKRAAMLADLKAIKVDGEDDG